MEKREWKLENIIHIMQLVCLALLFFSLYFNSDLPLIIAAIVMAICVVLSFYLKAKNKK